MSVTSPDRETLEAARRGDENAFAAVVGATGSLVLNLAWRLVRDRQEAEDLAQEVFLHLTRVFDRYDPDRPFLPWLRRVATNLMLNRTAGKARRIRRRTASLEKWSEEGGAHPTDPAAKTAPEEAGRIERSKAVRDAVMELKPEYRAILALRYFKGRAYEELARDLDLPLGTVKNRLYRAREALAGKLRERFGDEL
jgi:RNA polymerase sigma-70 factor (ECF subfamily)